MSEQRNDSLHRIEQLEIANRRWKMLSFAALAAVCVLLAITAAGLTQRPEPARPAAAQPPAELQFPVDRSSLAAHYANFCSVHVTPEELVLDFGLNTNMEGKANEPVKLAARVVMNYFTAKRLMTALQNVVQEHERQYGVLELDFQKRMRPGK